MRGLGGMLRSRRGIAVLCVLVTAAASGGTSALMSVPASAATTDIVTFSYDLTLPVPPPSSFSASAGGDGWGLAMTPTAVYNVFHHQSTMQVACHLQSDASSCFPPKTITDGSGNNFAVSGQPGVQIDQANGHLYVFGTRGSDNTAGVVCIDTNNAAAFCGYTPLTPNGDAPANSGVSNSVRIGSRLYAFNYVSGSGVTGGQNKLLCFDMGTQAACGGQPFTVPINGATVTSGSASLVPSVAGIGTQIMVAITTNTEQLACFDAATNGPCAGAWPAALTAGTVSNAGAAFPTLTAAGNPTGLCVATAPLQCFTLAGAPVVPSAALSATIGQDEPYNGPAVTIGPRVYVPRGAPDEVMCFDFNTGAGCPGFPKTFANLGYLYTVNPDPQRPTCLWVNADNGTQQIQNFDAFSGGACGQGAIRVLASSIVVPTDVCVPKSYKSLQILTPPRSSYTSGTVSFQDGSGLPLAPARQLDANGKVNMEDLNLNSVTGLPQFLIDLQNAGSPGQVKIRLTWTGVNDPSCFRDGTTTTEGTCQGKTPTINGTGRAEVIEGTPKRDIIRGGGGKDSIFGHGGNDVICGNRGDDTVTGGAGEDRLRGNKDEDVVNGNGGNDRLHGDHQDDRIFGGRGNDFLQGGSGDDRCHGGTGTNTYRACQ